MPSTSNTRTTPRSSRYARAAAHPQQERLHPNASPHAHDGVNGRSSERRRRSASPARRAPRGVPSPPTSPARTSNQIGERGSPELEPPLDFTGWPVSHSPPSLEEQLQEAEKHLKDSQRKLKHARDNAARTRRRAARAQQGAELASQHLERAEAEAVEARERFDKIDEEVWEVHQAWEKAERRFYYPELCSSDSDTESDD